MVMYAHAQIFLGNNCEQILTHDWCKELSIEDGEFVNICDELSIEKSSKEGGSASYSISCHNR